MFRRANVDEPFDLTKQLSDAAYEGRDDVVKTLLENGANANADMGPYESTPLYRAAIKGHINIVKILLAHDADANAIAWPEETPLRRALKSNYLDVADILVKHGADVHGKDKLRRTLLHSIVATRGGRLETVKLLVDDYGIDVNARDVNEITPLHHAVAYGHVGIVMFLLERGADVDAKFNEKEGEEGLTPILLAVRNRHLEIARILMTKYITVADEKARVDKKRKREGDPEDTENAILTRPATRPRLDEEPGRSPAEHQEHQYLDLVHHIIKHGQRRQDRTGTGTRSVFAPHQFRFDLANDVIPLITTKRVGFPAVVKELLWMVSGDTSAKRLSEKGVKIWNANGSREYLDKVGLGHRAEGDLGPVYGFQWRHSGAAYVDCDEDYTGKGFDQLKEVIHKIKNNPTDRRIVMSAWNPKDIPIMALPPCHMFCQFYVSTPTPTAPVSTLSCLLYQRSCDMGLGVPYNIASYAMLTRMIAHITGLVPGEFIHTMGDAHVYDNHVEALAVQLEREPRSFPRLKIAREVKDIDDFKVEDFVLEGYYPHEKICMNMSV